MRTRIIAVLNQKGGVGKTTTCVSLGAALARRGHRVLLIDMDPQANLTVHLGADFREVRNSTYSLLLGEHPLAPAVRATRDPNLRYVPATLALANAEIQLASAVGRELLLREALEVWLEDPEPGTAEPAAGEPARPRVDFVFIDCPPSLGVLTMNALCAANEVLLPIQCEFFALQGVAGILESLKAVQRLNRGLKLSMVVPCMVDKRKTLAREVLDEVDKYFGKLVTKTRIRNNVKLAEAPSHGMTIYEYDAASNGAKDYSALAREVLGETPEEDSDDSHGEDARSDSAPPAEPPAAPPTEPSGDAPTAPVAESPAEPPAAASEESAPGAPQDASPPDAPADVSPCVESAAADESVPAAGDAPPLLHPSSSCESCDETPALAPIAERVVAAADECVAAPAEPAPNADECLAATPAAPGPLDAAVLADPWTGTAIAHEPRS